MSSRYPDYSKGSSRSARDDSRLYEKRSERRRSRSRSRSPRRQPSSRSHGSRELSSSSRERKDYDERKSPDSQERVEEVPPPPPPPRITKISMDFTKPKAPIKMNISGPATVKVPVKPTISSVFNTDDDEDDEPEEMPAEARMRMRNIGRETPTSAGPNSFGKTKQGFCDAKKVFEKNLKEALDTANKPTGKFPQTIYKLGP